MFQKVLFLFFVSAAVLCVTADDTKIDPNCAKDEKCIDRKLNDILENIENQNEISLMDGVTIAKIQELEQSDAQSNEDKTLLDRVQNFVMTHELKIDEVGQSRSFDEGKGKSSKLKKFLLPLLLALKLKVAIILPAILSTITIIAVKGLFAGLIALLLSGGTVLKSFGEDKQDRVTTTILASPIQSDLRPHHEYRWARLGAEGKQALPPQGGGGSGNVPPQGFVPQMQQVIDPYAAYSGYQMGQLSPVQ